MSPNPPLLETQWGALRSEIECLMSPTSPSPQAIGLWRDMASGVAQSVYILIRPLSLLPNVQSGSNREIEATVNIEIEGLRYRKRRGTRKGDSEQGYRHKCWKLCCFVPNVQGGQLGENQDSCQRLTCNGPTDSARNPVMKTLIGLSKELDTFEENGERLEGFQ